MLICLFLKCLKMTSTLSKINKEKFFVPGKESLFYSFNKDAVINEFSKKVEETSVDDLHNWRVITNDEILRKPFACKVLTEPKDFFQW